MPKTMKKIIPLILLFLLVMTPLTFSKTNCENLNELQCRRSDGCVPLYNTHLSFFSYDYERCIEGFSEKRIYVNEFIGLVFNFIDDNLKTVTTAADVDVKAEEEQKQVDEIQMVYGKTRTVYIYAGSKLLAKVKDA
jgi:hypothetical protein